MLTPEAFNALLKTLEEPPEHAMFILATTEPHKLPATIISRCQRFDFHRITLTEQVDRMRAICMEEGIEAEEEALHYVARLSDGGMRDALSLLDQISTFAGSRITYEAAVAITGGIPQEQFRKLAEAILERNVGEVLQIVDQLLQEGKSADKCLENLLLYFRDLLMVLMAPRAENLRERLPEPETHRQLAERFGSARLFSMIETLNRFQAELKYAFQPQLILEVAVLKLCTEDAAAQAAGEEIPAQWKQELDQLRSAVHKLQQELVQLREARVSQGTGGDASYTSAASGTRSSSGTAAGTKSRSHSKTASSPRGMRSLAALEVFRQQPDNTTMGEVVNRWPSILQRVKERKITVHAWLIDGEPVAATKDAVLLAFKSAMHRETTEKPANRELIEQVIAETFGRPLALMTVMKSEWTELMANQAASSAPEVLELTPEDGGQQEQDWIKEAIELFGEDLVTIKED